MEKRILGICAILAIFITFGGFGLAQAATLSVSCTVPAIAGANAGSIQQASTRPETSQQQPVAQEQGYTLPKDIKTPVASMLQTDSKPAAASMLVQTFYSR